MSHKDQLKHIHVFITRWLNYRNYLLTGPKEHQQAAPQVLTAIKPSFYPVPTFLHWPRQRWNRF